MLNRHNNIYYIDYIELRSLGMFISTLLTPTLNTSKDDIINLHDDSIANVKRKELLGKEVA